MAEEQKEKFKAKYFRKPVSLFFALFGMLPFILFLINSNAGGKNSLFADALNRLKERNITDEAGTVLETIQGNPKPLIAILLILAVLLFMGITGTMDWMKRRFNVNFGNKLVPDLHSFVNTFGVWLAHWIVVSSFMIVFIVKVFDFYEILPALGLGKMSAYITWGMAFHGMARALVVFIVMKIIMFFLDKNREIRSFLRDRIVLGFTDWIKKVSTEQGARAAVCFIAFVLVVLGVCLVYRGVKPGPAYILKKAGSAVSFETVTGSEFPEALAGVSSQMNPRGISGIPPAGVPPEVNIDGPAGRYLVHSGLFCIVLSLAAMCFLVVRKNQQNG